MNDPIDRQAAIDAICNDSCGGHQDCKYYPWCESLRSVWQLPTVEAEPHWIPCSERLPSECGRYLCTVGSNHMNPREMYYAPQEWANDTDNATWREIDGSYAYDWFVEAWMPLPKPWGEENNDQTD